MPDSQKDPAGGNSVDASSRTEVVRVDKTPHSIAISHDGSRAYVTHFLPGSVTVIDTASSSVIATFAMNPGLYGVAVSLDDSWIYVANQDSSFVRRINSSDGQVSVDAGIGVTPYGLSMSPGGQLYAACPLNDAIEVLDGLVKNMAEVRDADFPVALAVSPDDSRLYATNYFSGTVSVIDASVIDLGNFNNEATVITKIPVNDAPYGVAASPDGTQIFVAHFDSNDAVSIIDTSSLSVTGTISVGSGPVRGVAVTPDGAKLYVTNYFSSSVSVIEL